MIQLLADSAKKLSDKGVAILDLKVDHLPAGIPLFDTHAQMIVAGGVFLLCFLWGMAKVIKAWKD